MAHINRVRREQMGARPMVRIFLLVWLVINHFDWQFFLVWGKGI